MARTGTRSTALTLLATVVAAAGASSAPASSANSPATSTGSGSGAAAVVAAATGCSITSASVSTETSAAAALADATITSGWLAAGAATAGVVVATAVEAVASADSSPPVRPSPAIRPPATSGNAAATQPCKAKAAPQASASLIFFWRSIPLFMLPPVHAPCGIRFSCHRARREPVGSRIRRANVHHPGSVPLRGRFPRPQRCTPCRKWRRAD